MASHTVDPPVVPAGDFTDPNATNTARRLHHFFEGACDRTPWAVALECEEQHLTYADLDARSNQVAHYLRRVGVGTGTRVAVLLPRSVGMYVSLLGVCKAGAAFVPLDPASPPERIAYILGDAGAGVLLTTGDLMPPTGLAETEEPEACRVIRTDTWASELACLPTTRPPADTSAAGRYENDPTAYIMYTSGSSGRPKGWRSPNQASATSLVS